MLYYISLVLYLHSFPLRKEKCNLDDSFWRLLNFLCCSKPSVGENILSGCIIYASPCPCHCVFVILSKMLWKKLSIIFKKFGFLWPKECSLPSLFFFFSSLLRLIRLLISATIFRRISLITPSSKFKSASVLASSDLILFSWNS